MEMKLKYSEHTLLEKVYSKPFILFAFALTEVSDTQNKPRLSVKILI